MRKRPVLIALAVALFSVSEAHALFAEQAVLAGPRNDIGPAADWNGSDDVFSWARSRAGHPNRYDAWVRVGSSTPIKLNRGGQGNAGGIDYPTVVYTRILNGRSNIYLFDLSNLTRPSTPMGVNTSKYEYRPTISGDWLLFGRDDNRSSVQRIILHNLVTGEERTLAGVRRGGATLYPGQVNFVLSSGTFATYTRCAQVCDVRVYNVATRATTTLPKPAAPLHQYSSAVAPDGAVYVVRSRTGCGANVKIVRYWSGDPRTGTVVARLPKRKADVGYMSARQSADGTTELFYGRVKCQGQKWDVYKITDPPAGP